jgi:hypothetical protein
VLRPLLAAFVLLALPVSAQAKLDLPELLPGEKTVLEFGADAALLNATVKLMPDVAEGVWGSVEVGKVAIGADGRALSTFVMPESFLCRQGCEGERKFFPGQKVSVSVCSVPATGGPVETGILTSSQFCLGGVTRVGGRVRGVRLKKVARLSGARWSRWGTAEARGRARGAVRATASEIVDCAGDLWYSAVDIRSGGRVTRLRGLAPC